MIYSIHRCAFSPREPYRYHVSDPQGDDLYAIERSNPITPFAEQTIRVLDRNGEALASVQPQANGHVMYWIHFPNDAAPRFGIEHTHTLADQLLRRSPCFRLIGIEQDYIARGSRHGAHFYEIFDSADQWRGEITPQSRGATYTVESASPTLSQLPLLLSLLTVVIDLHHADD
jgi:hypothetical protein